MPKRGAVAAKPAPTAELAKEADGKPVKLEHESGEPTVEAQDAAHAVEQAEEAKPGKKGGRRERDPEEKAAARAAHQERHQPADKDHGEPEGGFEDWTEPDYANDPGEFEFDSMEDSDEHLSILWWGREGTGKTTDLARVATTKLAAEIKGNVLLINAEAGAKRTALQHHGIDTSRIKLYPPRGTDLTFEGLERLFYRIQADLAKDPTSWAAVGWDSITAIHQKLLDDVIEEDMRRQAEILQKAKKTRTGRSGNITLRSRFDTDRDDYREMSNQVRLLLRKYRTLPCHFLVTALERRDEDKSERKGTSKVQYGPAISPALQVDLLGYMDLVVRCHVLDEGVYYGRTTPTEDARGKDRMFALPVELVDPTFDRIFGYVRGSIKPETDRAQRRMPNGAEGIQQRRSLADDDSDLPYDPPTDEPVEDAPYHTQDGTPDGPPLAGDEDDPEPPKRGGRRAARSSTGAAASKPPARSAEQPSGSGGASPKRGGRRTPRTTPEEQAAKQAVQGEEDKPATRAAIERAEKAKQAVAAKSGGGFSDEPPF